MSRLSSKRTEVVSEVVFLGKLVERIVSGKIRVPKFQRAFVWRQSDLHSLLDSVFRGFPIGSILVWDTDDDIESRTSVGPVQIGRRPTGTVGYLLDGQQRVSTLVGTLRLAPDANDAGQTIVDDLDWALYCDLDSAEFMRAPKTGLEPQHFPVRSLLNTAGFFEACRRIVDEVKDRRRGMQWLEEADRLASAFRDYQLPLIHIREANLDSAVTVFARLNRTGRKMTADEMVSALTYEEDGFHLAAAFTEFRRELTKLGFGNLDRVLLLRSVLAALELDIYAQDWATLIVKQDVRRRLPSAFEAAADGLRRALGFLRGVGVTSDRLLPYGLQLVLLGEFFRLCPDPTEETRRVLERWFWVTSFSGWFGGVGGARVRLALQEMRELAKGEVHAVQVVDLESPAAPFPSRFDGRSARVRAFLLFLGSLGPRSLEKPNQSLDPGELLASRGTEAVGYVVANRGGGHELFSSPANRMFVDAYHFGQTLGPLQDKNDDQLKQLLPTHGFDLNSIELLREGQRESLIRERIQTLIKGEREFMERKHVKIPTGQIAPSVADSEASDQE